MSRSWQSRLLLSLIVLVYSAQPSGPTELAADRINWMPSWEEAVEKALAEKKPIMIHFNMDDEPACRNMASAHFRDKRIIELSKKFVCVVGSLGKHKGEKVFTESGTCGRFGTVTCAQHRFCESKARSEVLESSTVTAPQFVFTTPELEIIVRRPWDLPPGELLSLMSRALYYYNPDLSPEARDKRKEELLDNLIKEGKSDNAATRKKALDSIAKRDDPKIIRFLIGQCSSSVDLIKRIEAVKAIGEAGNANCLPALLETLKDRSPRLRKVSLIALGKLNMVEAIDPVAKQWGIDGNADNKALGIRTVVKCDPENATVRKLLGKGLKTSKRVVRVHAVRAALDVDVNKAEFERLVKLAKGDSEVVVRACACHAATTLAVRYRDSNAVHISEKEKKAYASRRKQVLAATEKKLRPALRKVSTGDKEEALRELAKRCLMALDSQDFVDLDGDLDEFHNDEELFKDDAEGGTANRKRRGGRGRR